MVCAAGAFAFVMPEPLQVPAAFVCPRCGQPHAHQQWVGTNETSCGLRIADNPAYTHDWCPPTYAWTLRNSALRTTTAPPRMGVHQRVCWRGSGGLVKRDNIDPRPGETGGEIRPVVNFYENTPPEAPVWTPHCGQQPRHPSLVSPTNCTNQHNACTDPKFTWGNAEPPSIRAQPVPG